MILYLLLLLSLGHSSAGWMWSGGSFSSRALKLPITSAEETSRIQHGISPELDLVAIVSHGKELQAQPEEYATLAHMRLSNVYGRAITIIANATSSNSCYRNSVSRLLANCNTLRSSRGATDVTYDHLQEQYAASLAICELPAGDSRMPKQCRDMQGPVLAEPLSIRRCLKWLRQDGRWISYSNNLQTVRVLTEATTAENERGVSLLDKKELK